jgi:hypothetical protein
VSKNTSCISHLQQIVIAATTAVGLIVVGLPTAEGIIITKKPKDYMVRPVVQDGGADGLNLTGLNDTVPFDIDGDGTNEQVTWTMLNADTGFFWVDLNGNGKVDNGTELFGADTHINRLTRAANGFVALAQYDLQRNGGNGDGVLSAADTVWQELKLWVDWNHNGAIDPGETSTMDDLHIQSIDLTSQPVNLSDPNGNYVLTYATVHGAPGYEDSWALDVLFQRNGL